MAILTGRIQSLPEIDQALHGRYSKISKADWADLYFDLFRETHGETAEDETVMEDAERRMLIIEQWREAEMQSIPCYLCGGPMGAGEHQCYKKGKQ
jgi:hypothetical protein